MSDIMIKGVPVTFPFEPYGVQRAYMEKVIECLQNGYNGVLESPTGTGKTLSLLCSSLAWLLVKKAQIQINAQMGITDNPGSFMNSLESKLKNVAGKHNKGDGASTWGMPKILYASRTHSQLSQAMQELKRTSYRHLKTAVLGSRDQMCIHPEVSKETNNTNKVNMCQIKVKTRTCYFFNNVDSKKDDIKFRDDILDIEDLVKVGKTTKCCPYFVAKELKQNADIIFLPYNYLLDPKSRKANGIELANNVIILDEAHNVEKMCEESASLQISSTEIALCIDEVTHIMKIVADSQEGTDFSVADNSQPKDFSPEDLCVLKKVLLEIEKVVDDIPVPAGEGVTFGGDYLFELLAKAQINESNSYIITTLIDNLVQYLTMASGSSPFQRKGTGLQKFSDLLNICFGDSTKNNRSHIVKCYKVHVHLEEKKKKTDTWSSLKGPSGSSTERVISYWCFSPGFGMKQLISQNVRCVILTSGTLAPLKPLTLELGIPIQVRLENPHVINQNQIYVKIMQSGPDGTMLNSNYENRNNPKYISSLGRTILSFTRVIPDGLLVFFPSYPILAKCQQEWQLEGIWANISDIKPIYVEPRGKDAFNATMADFYSKINDPASRGACFMAVCRGKVSEGLDFADMNGRGVIITGLPFPPLKDPRIVLKKKYLEEQRTKDNEFLSGDEWYSLEASRAVNQAIGRVIRHKNDYGAILLCDTRFNNPRFKAQISSWLRGRLAASAKFGETVGEVCRFFKNAEKTLPSPKLRPLRDSEIVDATKNDVMATIKTNIRTVPKKVDALSHLPKSHEVLGDMEYYKNISNHSTTTTKPLRKASDLFDALDCSDEASVSSSPSPSFNQVTIHKRDRSSDNTVDKIKRKRYKILPFGFDSQNDANVTNAPSPPQKVAPKDLIEFVKCVKVSLEKDSYKEFQTSISTYKASGDYEEFIKVLDKLFYPNPKTHYLLNDMGRFLKDNHKSNFKVYQQKLNTR